MSMKILVSGDISGNISTLFKRVETVNNKVSTFTENLALFTIFNSF